MIPESVKEFIDHIDYALVASTDAAGKPHLAASKGVRITDDDHIEFDEWFCRRTLENVAGNPFVAVMLMEPSGHLGYQLSGKVESTHPVAVLNGYAPGREKPGLTQFESALLVRIDAVTHFSTRPHTDRVLGADEE